MCVVAGYIGSRSAAPVLIDMLRREQGMGGGYYTGIATIHDGQLHYEKVLGDLDTLLAQTCASQLPGTIGIAHGRSKSGGEREWAHPFVDDSGALAYLANGYMGAFKDTNCFVAAGNEALERGERFLSAVGEPVGTYPVLSDGSCVHMSEVMAHEIAHRHGLCDHLADAMASAYIHLPSEVVGLSIHAGDPDSFAACRINFPLIAGRDADGLYAASTSLAFPESVHWTMPIPANSSATVGRSGVTVNPLEQPPKLVALIPSPKALLETVVERLISAGPQTFGALCGATASLWPEGMLDQKGMATFETLAALAREGLVQFSEDRVPGQYDRGTAPLTQVTWVG